MSAVGEVGPTSFPLLNGKTLKCNEKGCNIVKEIEPLDIIKGLVNLILPIDCGSPQIEWADGPYFCKEQAEKKERGEDVESCMEVVQRNCDQAYLPGDTIHAAIYAFTLKPMADYLRDKIEEGVDVKIAADENQVDEEIAASLRSNMRLLLPSPYEQMHHKFVVINNQIVCEGSFNWTNAANFGTNYEDLICFSSSDIAGEYERAFAQLWQEGR